MNPKMMIGVGLIALLSIGGAAFAVSGVGTSEPASTDSAETAAQQEGPVVPVPSMPAELQEDAQRLIEVNQIISEVTQEALDRPKDDRMTPEEVGALVRERIAELEVRP